MINLKCEIAYLDSLSNSQLSLQQTDEILGKKLQIKSLFKEKDRASYDVYRHKIKRLRAEMLPYRVVDIVKAHLKSGRLIPSQIAIPEELKRASREDRKRLISEFEKSLVAKAGTVEGALQLAAQLLGLHGMPAATLAFLCYTDYYLLPTGVLLDLGIAPMCGELNKGGMDLSGVNQSRISFETIRDISRVEKYAKGIEGSHFVPPTYDAAEGSLKHFMACSPDDSSWDQLLIALLRFKQWDPEGFKALTHRYQSKIEQFQRESPQRISYYEQAVLKALDYPLEVLQAAIHDSQIRENLGRELKSFEPLNILFDPQMKCRMEGMVKSFIEGRDFGNRAFANSHSYIIADVIRFRLFGEEEIDNLKRKAMGSDEDESQEAKIILRRVQCKLETQNFTVEQILNVYVRNRILARIQAAKKPFERRLERMKILFDKEPFIHLTDADRNLILKPFPVVLASTKTKPTKILSEFSLHKARLGDEIDLAFVPSYAIKEMTAWLEAHHLSEKVKVYSNDTLEQMKTVPLYHAPHQVYGDESYFEEQTLRSLAIRISTSVAPLYRLPYSDQSARRYHGVTHAVRATLFACMVAEMYRISGFKISCRPDDLMVTMALHDCARQNDGPDLWDKESAMKAREVSLAQGRSEHEASLLERSILSKDEEGLSALEPKIIHDGDCIEILRCLHRPQDFNPNKLWFYRELDREAGTKFIDEASRFIQFTEQEPIRLFIEKAANPFGTLIQILNAAKGFDLMKSYLNTHFYHDHENLLSSQIEEYCGRMRG